jgi:phospholipase/carboxylesterase
MASSIVIQQPQGTTKQLFLLFHGVGSTPESLRSVAQALAQEFPYGLVVCIAAPFACDLGSGLQWFSVQGITENNRRARVQEAMPHFVQTVTHWQAIAGLGAAETALVGFSQGAIMALEASLQEVTLASRVVAHSGRFVTLPDAAPARTTLHLIHGKNDQIIPYGYCIEAAHCLQSLGADFTANVIPFLEHQMSHDSVALMLLNLKTHLPQHIWAAAMQADAQTPSR